MSDTRTPQEIAYDAQKDGSAYTKPQTPADPAPNLPQDIKDWIDRHLEAERAEEITLAKEADRIIAEQKAAKPVSPLIQAAREMDRLKIPLDAITSLPAGTHGNDAILAWMQEQIALAALPSIEAQIAAIPPTKIHTEVDILAVTLPTGEELTRCTFGGRPADWVEIRRGDVAIDIRGDGRIAGVLIGGTYVDDVSEQDWETLRQLLAVDRQKIGAANRLSAAVVHAIDEWENQPYAEWVRLHETIGFGAWYRQRPPGRP